jgi:hypothetical protein
MILRYVHIIPKNLPYLPECPSQLSAWRFRLSSPYRCNRYDTCHIDELGEGGDHLWPLTLEVLEKKKLKTKVNSR